MNLPLQAANVYEEGNKVYSEMSHIKIKLEKYCISVVSLRNQPLRLLASYK